MSQLWHEMGLDPAILQNHREFAEFLKNTKLIYSIVGFRETINDPAEPGIKMIEGQPALQVKGNWMPWNELKMFVGYDDKTEQLMSKKGPLQYWTYVSPRLGGLIPHSRLFYEKTFAVHKLTQEEFAKFDTNGKGVLQIVSTPRRVVPLLGNFNDWAIAVHIYTRLITPEGFVYSYGGQINPLADKFVRPLCCKGLATVGMSIAMLDFEEFKDFKKGERLVTNIPINAKTIPQKLQAIEDIHNHQQLPFNMLHQNCSLVAAQQISDAGHEIDNCLSLKQVIWNMVPTLDSVPIIGTVWKAIKAFAVKVWSALPSLIRIPLTIIAKVITWFPNKLLTMATNIFVLAVGGAQQAHDIKPGYEDELDNRHRLTTFSRLWQSWTHLFSDEPSIVYHHHPIIEWQRSQASTVSYNYTGRPELYMLPVS